MFEREAEEYYYKKIFAETNPKSETELKEKFLQTFKDGAEFCYNKAKEEMQAQIEKMKCCEMCKHKNLNWGFSPICEARDKIKIENPLTCKCDKWEIKEND